MNNIFTWPGFINIGMKLRGMNKEFIVTSQLHYLTYPGLFYSKFQKKNPNIIIIVRQWCWEQFRCLIQFFSRRTRHSVGTCLNLKLVYTVFYTLYGIGPTVYRRGLLKKMFIVYVKTKDFWFCRLPKSQLCILLHYAGNII